MSAVSYTGLSGIPALGYTYDNNGNITALKQGSATKESYTYDALNQLTRVDSLLTNKTTVYAYDNGGNITGVKEYAYTTGSLEGLTPTSTKTYTYGNASWPDLLTAYDGTPITYDAIGNPTSYRGASMTWSGRRLSSYSKSGVTVSYVYNESGIRTSKTVNGTTTEYFLSGSTILAEKTGSSITWYLYDSLGNPVGYEYGGAKYWYITNLQGDIIYVVNSAGTPIGSYTYSPYGDFSATVLSSSDSTAFSANHLTYRGYYYDAETGLYYVSSRYYDPEICRWINADDSANLGADGSPLSYNLFAYCMNNPVNRIDVNGNWSGWATAGVIVGAVLCVTAVSILTCGVGTATLAGAIAVGAAKGAIVGAFAGTVVGSGIGYATTGTLEGAATGAAIGFGAGAMIGAAVGGMSAGLKYGTFSSKKSLAQHFAKHGDEFGNMYSNAKEYAEGAKHVIKNGTFIPEKNAYIKFLGTQGKANYAFVGLKSGGRVSTYHVRSVGKMIKDGISLFM